MDKINGNSSQNRINRSNELEQQRRNTPKTDRRFQSFVDEALKTSEDENTIHFSNHAQKRMEQKGIEFDSNDLLNLDSAFTRMDEKGSENSLIMYDDLSLIASIKNRTIITASKTDEMTEVTNIDSAIQVKK